MAKGRATLLAAFKRAIAVPAPFVTLGLDFSKIPRAPDGRVFASEVTFAVDTLERLARLEGLAPLTGVLAVPLLRVLELVTRVLG